MPVPAGCTKNINHRTNHKELFLQIMGFRFMKNIPERGFQPRRIPAFQLVDQLLLPGKGKGGGHRGTALTAQMTAIGVVALVPVHASICLA